MSYPKVALGSGVPEHHQVGVGELPLVGHPQQHALVEVGHPQLHVDLLGGVADVPGQVDVSTGVEGHVEGHGERRERARGPRFHAGQVDGDGGSLVGRHQDHHEGSQSGEVHDGDVLQTKVPVEDPHFSVSLEFQPAVGKVSSARLRRRIACFIRDSSPAGCLVLSRLTRLRLSREIGLSSLSPGVNHDPTSAKP